MRRINGKIMAVILAAGVWMTGCGGAQTETAASDRVETAAADRAETAATDRAVAAEGETVAPVEVVQEGMTPVYAEELRNGVYPVQVDSSSEMFQITSCELTVQDGRMQAVMTMSGTGYLKLYMGTGEEAAKAAETDFIPFTELADGTHTFEVPVEALDTGIDCSAFSKRKEKWYDRVLVFRADSLPAEAFASGMVTAESLGLEDGNYTVEVVLAGGSGRASMESPAAVRVENGSAWVTVIWGSSNYDYMKVDGTRYDWDGAEGNSAFEIPLAYFDREIPVSANTTAMSTPHEIDYTLRFDSSTIKKAEGQTARSADAQTTNFADMAPAGSMELQYADQFSVDYYDGGYAMISVGDGGRYLVVPEGMEPPQGLDAEVTVIQQPVAHIYLAATSAMDLIRCVDGVDKVTLSAVEADGWYIEEAKEAMASGSMKYAGKYRAPEYEMLLSEHCDLSIQSTMIYHNPEVREQMEKLGIPVFVERSSYESHPLGRMEWIKVYGTLLGREELAEKIYDEQLAKLDGMMEQEPTGKTVAFFYITSKGMANVRKPGDYIARAIELAGGSYVPSEQRQDENALSTMNMQMEAFYAGAKDADYLIYNSNIDGELRSLDEFLAKSPLLADFKAVKDGHVWCTGRNMFQESMGVGEMLADIHRMISGAGAEEMTYLYPLR